MEIANLSNTPINFELAGKSYKIRRPSILELFAEFENDVKAEYMDDIISFASKIKDVKERIQVQKEAIRDMPKGKDLQEKAQARMDGLNGGIKILYNCLSKLNEVTLKEVSDIVTNPKYQTQITTIMDYLVGNDVVKEEEVKPAGAEVITLEKKT